MAERTDRTKCPSPKKPAVLLLYTLCFSALFATASASDSLSGRDAGSAASEVLSHPIAASTSVHGTGGALDRSASSSGSARAILQVDSSQPQQAAVKKDATAGKPQAPVEPRQPAGGAPPAEDAFDPYNDYELYTKGYDYDRNVGDSGEGYDDMEGDYFFKEEAQAGDCLLGAGGKPVLSGTYKDLCSLVLSGANKHVPLLPGGLDGTYGVHSCENGRPTYLRAKSPPGQDRLLWYSAKHKDWDISTGIKSDQDDILLYGGEGAADLHPEFVPTNMWHIASEFDPAFNGTGSYVKASITLKCAGIFKATPTAPKQTNFGTKPFLTDAEMEEQYRRVYDKARVQKQAANESSDMVFLFVVLAAAAAAVVGIPLCLSRRLARRGGKGGGWISLVTMGGGKAAD